MTKKTLSDRIKKADATQAISVRIPLQLLKQVRAKAEREGVTVTAIVLAAFEQYLEGK